MAEHLPNVLTPLTPAELASALVAGWRSLLGETPSRQAVLLLIAQSAHETGEWRAVHCWNLGNVKGVEGDGRDYTMFRCREVVGGKTVFFDPPHPATRFRAFRSLAEGALDHLAFLHGRPRYAAAWAALDSGDPLTFAAALKVGAYFTDPLSVYARGLRRYVDKFNQTLPTELEPVAIDEETAARAQGLVALSLRDLASEFVTGDTDPAPPDEEPTS